MRRIVIALGMLVTALASFATAATRPPMEAFFSGQRVSTASISPDGRYVSIIVTGENLTYVAVVDRQHPGPAKPVLQLNPQDHASFNWCHWANNTRIVCSAMYVTDKPLNSRYESVDKFYPLTRLVAFNFDGSNFKALAENRHGARSTDSQGQLLDRIIDWTWDDPDTVLIQLPDDSTIAGVGPQAVFKLNINTGSVKLFERSRDYIGGFTTDGRGNVRLGAGIDDTETLRFMARTLGSDSWREIVKHAVNLADDQQLEPLLVVPGTNDAYAIGGYEGREALWQMDLTGTRPPELVFSHPTVDVHAMLGPDQQLLGVGYDTDKPEVQYLDADAEQLQTTADLALPNQTNRLISFARNMKIAIVSSERDNAAPAYYVLDASEPKPKLERLGGGAPGLANYALATVKSVTFPARDGTQIPAYLTRPINAAPGKVPLVVLPHGGPYARDHWGFDGWVQFLASRGYAVLQIEYRGSTGYGHDWFRSGLADWGGLPHSDVVDGTNWAIDKGYADADRVCIVGASFGGFMALTGATRDGKLYRCAMSISGVSDLNELVDDRHFFAGWKIARQAIGKDSSKLKRDSPRLSAAEVQIPIMLLHGDQDFTVEVDQSVLMDKALNEAGKAHEFVIVKGADHYFREEVYMRALFTNMERFLTKNLGPGAPEAP